MLAKPWARGTSNCSGLASAERASTWPPGAFDGWHAGVTWNHLWYLAYLWVYTVVLAVLLELSWLPGFAEVRPLLIVTVLLLTLCSGLHYVWAWTRLYRRQRKGVTL